MEDGQHLGSFFCLVELQSAGAVSCKNLLHCLQSRQSLVQRALGTEKHYGPPSWFLILGVKWGLQSPFQITREHWKLWQGFPPHLGPSILVLDIIESQEKWRQVPSIRNRCQPQGVLRMYSPIHLPRNHVHKVQRHARVDMMTWMYLINPLSLE